VKPSELARCLFFVMGLSGCDLKIVRETKSLEEFSPTSAIVYPVSPRAHVDLPDSDPLDPSTFPRNVSNAIAISRYAMGMATKSLTLLDAKTNGDLSEGLKTLMARSSLSPQMISETFKLGLSAAESREASQKIRESFPGAEFEGTYFEKSFLFGKRLAQCVARSGASPANCCEAFLVPMLLFSEDKIPTTYSLAIEASKVDVSSFFKEGDPNFPVFKHSGARTWLSQCYYPTIAFPRDLEEFKLKYGDFKKWGGDFHPFSMAKQGPRRLYRQNSPAISVAETLGANCEVRETEVVIEGPKGETTFGAFNGQGRAIEFSEFPAANGRIIIRSSPDSCLGCHLKLDTRKFNVRIPSFLGLGLTVMEQHRIPMNRDPAACARSGENVIWDKPQADLMRR